jgi:hypothetical protein
MVCGAAPAAEFEILPFLEEHCVRCHGGEKVRGKVDFRVVGTTGAALREHFETWELASELVTHAEMPPEDEPPLSKAEQAAFRKWYHRQFQYVEARPGDFRIRRLSAVEFRNTLRSLFGFDLEVAVAEADQTSAETSLVLKLLPTDPPGSSGYKNDTQGNPLSMMMWDQYAYLVNVAVEQFVDARERRQHLEAYTGPIAESGMTSNQAQQLLRTFIRRAWRRPGSEETIASPLAALAGKEGEELTAALKIELQIALMAPEFLYRGALVRPIPGKIAAVDDFELAERLSYFLWADMPDGELLSVAESGKLSRPEIFAEQIQRMLQSPKARSLTEDFAVQWLLLDGLEDITKEKSVSDALKNQPREFLHYLISENRPLTELLDSRTTFANIFLASYYGADQKQLEPYQAPMGKERETVPLQRVQLSEAEGRGGLLTMPAILAMNRGPILRGTWVLERILGERLGEPPPDVPPIKTSKGRQKLSFREQFSRHRDDQTCSYCHDKIDPIGFAFEAYDPKGAFRLAEDYGSQGYGPKRKKGVAKVDRSQIDASGRLPGGETFEDFEGLREIFAGTLRERVVENLVRQTMAYGLCRKLTIYDEPVVAELTEDLSRADASWHDLIYSIATSLSFRKARFGDAES